MSQRPHQADYTYLLNGTPSMGDAILGAEPGLNSPVLYPATVAVYGMRHERPHVWISRPPQTAKLLNGSLDRMLRTYIDRKQVQEFDLDTLTEEFEEGCFEGTCTLSFTADTLESGIVNGGYGDVLKGFLEAVFEYPVFVAQKLRAHEDFWHADKGSWSLVMRSPKAVAQQERSAVYASSANLKDPAYMINFGFTTKVAP